MAVRFVIGRAGTGKTAHCVRAMVEAMKEDPLGDRSGGIYWILPRQATFSAERELVCSSGLGALSRVRVVSLDELAREVLEECRGGAVPEITPLGRQMLLGHLLRKLQPELKFFTGVARQPGLAARLDATFAEFDRCGKEADELANLAGELRTSGNEDIETKLLADKVGDFHVLYRAYRAALGAERVDPHRRLDQVLACVHESERVRGATIYVDGFIEFSEVERKMLVALAKSARRMEVTLLVDPDSKTIADPHHLPAENSVFWRLEETYRRLALALAEAGVEVEKPLVLREAKRFSEQALVAVERSFAESEVRAEAERNPGAGEVEFVEAMDRRGEVNAAARRIRDRLREGKLRLREIVVLVREMDEYHELVSAAFREHGIPFFADRRRLAGHHPLLQFVRALFLLARGGWPHEAVMALVKSGLTDLSADEGDELENYVLLHRIRGRAWTAQEDWNYVRTVRRDEEDVWTPEKNLAQRMDRLRRRIVKEIAPFLERVSKPATVREIVGALFELFERFGIRKRLSEWIADAGKINELEQRGEHEQVWRELVELFDQMIDLLGDETVELADVVETLEAGLEQFDLALTPPTVDQVLVGQADRTRTAEAKVVIVLGLGDGQFPRVPREDSVLSDSERKSLRERKLDVEADSERRLLDENLFGYIAFTRASERLIVTRAIADEANRPLAPGAFWQRLRDIFPDAQVSTEPRETDARAEDIATPRQLVTGLMRWARGPSKKASPDAGVAATEQQPWPGLYQWLATYQCCYDAIDVMRFKAWKALSYRNEAGLSKEIAQRLFKSPLDASVTRVEAFATCPFKHFAAYGLELREREEDDVTAMDLGNVYHQILERLVAECLRKRQDWCELEANVTAEMIRDFAKEVGKSLRGELMLSTARNQYLLKRIEKTLEQVVATQREILKRGAFRPRFVELEFGRGDAEDKLPAYTIKTPGGNEIRLRGKIDRVDVLENEAAFAVIDYKLSGKALQLARVYHGLSLQLLTYLLVLQNSGEKLAGKKLTPVAAFYSQLLRSLESVAHPEEGKEPEDPLFALKVKPRGIFDANYIARIDGELVNGKSDVVAAYIKSDSDFGFKDSTDVASNAEFGALLKFVEKKIAMLADRIIAGEIGVTPYRIGRQSPCPYCEYRAVCRFDVSVNRYNTLSVMKRSAVLEQVVKEAGDGK